MEVFLLKKTMLTCPKVGLIFVCYSLFIILISVFIAFLIQNILVGCIFVLFIESFAVFGFWCLWGRAVFRAWIPVSIDEKGVSNRYCKISWDEIEGVGFDYLQYPLDRMRFREADVGMILYFSKKKDRESLAGCSLRDTVFFPKNQKSIELIRQYAPDVLERLGMKHRDE